jgi:hypothetical protein
MPVAMANTSVAHQKRSNGNVEKPHVEISIPGDSSCQYATIDIQVRNTFIHLSDDVDCYERFCLERAVQSCPGVHVGRLTSAFAEDMEPSHVPTVSKPVIRLQDMLVDTWPATPEPFQAASLMKPNFQCALPCQPALPPWRIPKPTNSSMVTSEAKPSTNPADTSAQFPSAGSALHFSGECKPCAFLYTKGCENGPSCNFCHLCDAGEKKRRQREKRAAMKGGA